MPRKNTGPKLGINEAGFYEIKWTEPGSAGKKGRSRRASTWTTDLAEAQAALAEFLNGDRRKAEGEYPVEDIIDAYLTGHAANKQSIKKRITAIMSPLRVFFGNRDVATLTPDDCIEYEKKRRTGKVKGFPSAVSGGTIRLEIAYLSAAINNAVRNRRLPKKLTPDLVRPPKPAAREDWVQPDVYRNTILPALRTHDTGRSTGAKHRRRAPRLTRLYRFMVIAFNTAQRRTAIETLTWDQIDLTFRMINFNPPGRLQTKKRRPVVPINDELFAMLTEAYKERRPGCPYVLDTSSRIDLVFDKFREAIGLPWLTRHTIRRTWATWAAIRGVSMTDIAAILGDDVKTVEDNYLKFAPGYLRGAVHNPVPLSAEDHFTAAQAGASIGAANGALHPDQGAK